MSPRTNKIIKFLKKIEKLKFVEREIYLSNGRKENSAEHSWHVTMFLILFDRDLPKKLDRIKMLKMALMHDLVEVYAGDTFAFDKSGKKQRKIKLELESAKKLFSQLPNDLSKEFNNLFLDYENSKSDEAKFVQSFDKIQPILQN